MRREILIQKLTPILDQGDVERFLESLREAIPNHPAVFGKIEAEWAKSLKSQALGMMDYTQSKYSLQAYFKDFIENDLAEVPDEDILLEYFEKAKQDLKLEIAREKDNEGFYFEPAQKVERPLLITILTMLHSLLLVYNLVRFFDLLSTGTDVPDFLYFTSILFVILRSLHIYGLWAMYKWNLVVLAVLFVFELMVRIGYSGGYAYDADVRVILLVLGIFVSIVYSVILLLYYRFMR